MSEQRNHALDPTHAGAHRIASLVVLDDQPAIMALYQHGLSADPAACVVAWVIALPGGDAVILSALPGVAAPIMTTLANVQRRWAERMQAELVNVSLRDNLRLAA